MIDNDGPTVEIIRQAGALGFYKHPRTWKRNLEIRLTHPGDSEPFHHEPFPREVNHVTIDGLDPEKEVDVLVQSGNILRRMKYGIQDFRLQPKPRPFRIIISGSGRCGTTTLARYLDGMSFTDGQRVVSRHETLNEYLLPCVVERQDECINNMVNGMAHNVESAPYFAHVPELMTAEKVILLVRDGRRVCQSGINRNWYETGSIWNQIKPEFEGTIFEKICHFWRYCNEQVETISTHFARLEDLSESEEARQKLLHELDLVSSGQVFPHSNKGKAPSVFGDWTDEMKETFTEINGEMMDRYYPGWRETW